LDKAIPTASRRRRPATDLEGFDRVTSGIGRYEGEDADDVDEDEEEVNCKPIMHQCRMLRIEGIVGLTWEPVISTGMRWSMATIQIRMRKNKHHKPMMDQRRMWRTDGILGVTSVSNGSKPLERFRVRVGTGIEPLQRVLPHEKPGPLLLGRFPPENPAMASPGFSL